MIYIDSWGRESNTLEEAKEKILETLRQDEDYYGIIGEYLIIPSYFFDWIVSTPPVWEKFKEHFSEEIKEAELDWADYYFEEIEEIDN